MLLLLEVVAVLAIIAGVAILLTSRTEALGEAMPDAADTGLPRERVMTPQDVVQLRFALAFRGYRMSEVDDALDRLAAELGARDVAIETLRDQLAAAAAEPDEVAEPTETVATAEPPAPEPQPEPLPTPEPIPDPQPVPEPQPIPEPEPLPEPVPMPEPAPVPEPHPLWEPAKPTWEPEPVDAPAPEVEAHEDAAPATRPIEEGEHQE